MRGRGEQRAQNAAHRATGTAMMHDWRPLSSPSIARFMRGQRAHRAEIIDQRALPLRGQRASRAPRVRTRWCAAAHGGGRRSIPDFRFSDLKSNVRYNSGNIRMIKSGKHWL
ncbi:hypothetical protein F511_46907 [Dorcoceras hygrometricum]|uniref:Uncharacterized protein n=1 Tax=Dorcoceras hygrometricum TaxID=472368 RepID=A0A2Z6ZYT6_9LAMI|nr:hypothetical protein F511_46907 [Dorcoceras hygrometricum]